MVLLKQKVITKCSSDLKHFLPCGYVFYMQQLMVMKNMKKSQTILKKVNTTFVCTHLFR